jgi:RimJ/RimL family protein N-acetyltransferase
MTTLLDWKAPPFPPAKVLEGQYCRLEPLDVARHLDEIWAATAGHDHIWDWLPATPPKDKEAYRALLTSMVEKAGIVPLAVIDKVDGKAKGHLWIMEIRPEQGVFEVGWITYAPSLQRTRPATEAIYLVGEYGFSLGYRRYEWKCNNLNEPSKRAALRFGFQYQGQEPRYRLVLDPRQRMADSRARLPALARAGEFRRERRAETLPCRLQPADGARRHGPAAPSHHERHSGDPGAEERSLHAQ